MVKVHAPAMSMEASGKLGGCIVFAKWKGRAYARSLVKPHNPRSPMQYGVRSMMRALSQHWVDMTAPNKATFNDLAEATNISPFNAYISYNMSRWREGKGIAVAYPAAAIITPTTLSTFTASAAARHIDLAITLTSGTNNLGVAIARDLTTGFVPTWANTIRVLVNAAGTSFPWTDGPLVPDTYYYRAAALTNDGVIGTWKTECNGIVT